MPRFMGVVTSVVRWGEYWNGPIKKLVDRVREDGKRIKSARVK